MVGSHTQRLFQSCKKSYCWSKLQVSEAGCRKFFGLNARTRPRFGGRSAGQCTKATDRAFAPTNYTIKGVRSQEHLISYIYKLFISILMWDFTLIILSEGQGSQFQRSLLYHQTQVQILACQFLAHFVCPSMCDQRRSAVL